MISIKGIGPSVKQRLSTLGIHSVADLLQHYPSRYDDFSEVVTIAAAPLDQPITMQAVIKKIAARRSWQRRGFSLVEATVTDDTGQLKVVWFNQNYITEQLTEGTVVVLAGKIKQTKYGKQLVNPVFEKAKADLTHTGRLVPHYPTTYRLTQKQLRYFIKQALELPLDEWLPEDILETFDLLPYPEAIQKIHFPETNEEIELAKHRLGFDELLLMQLVSLQLKQNQAVERATQIPNDPATLQLFTKQLPFQLTVAQKKSAWDIIQDLNQPVPMNRLLEGDVGAGKTVVAAMALYTVAKAGFGGVLMAPTEVLAQQHFHKLVQLLSPFQLPIGLITAHDKIFPTARIVVGTHALLTSTHTFPKLALAIIDEQHRFGVAQRQALKAKSQLGTTPHLLSMTATPIPRTLALTAYGDLALSIIDELPRNRRPIITTLVTSEQRPAMYQTVAAAIQRGEQVYVVAPRIEEDETSEKTSVEQEAVRIHEHLPNARLQVLHGQLKAKDKRAIMDQFRHGELDLLVSTTVIEVGVDVPNATVMVIENAEVFGLAQLHQLRGRVGRADKASVCFVCTATPTQAALERLQFFTQTSSGFTLAEYDLDRRGPGAVYGKEQSGFLSHFKVAKLSDHALLQKAQQAAATILPDIEQYPVIQQKINHLLEAIHLE